MLAVAVAAAAAARYFAGSRCMLRPAKMEKKTLPPHPRHFLLTRTLRFGLRFHGGKPEPLSRAARSAGQPANTAASESANRQRASSESHPAASQPIINNTQPASSQRASQQAANQQPEPASSQQAASQQPEPASSQPITSSQQLANNEPKMLLQKVLLCAYVFAYDLLK